jgi:transmembrane sensor
VSTTSSRAAPSPQVRADAAAWVAKLHSSDRTKALEAALKAWLAEDAAHSRAFELATRAWELGGAVPGTSVPRIEPAARRTGRPLRWRLAFGAAAAVAAAVVVVVLVLRDPTYATGVGEQRSLALADGTRVTLNTDSRLAVHYTEGTRLVRLERGEAFFDVGKNPHRPFIVTAGGESVTATGTAFSVRRDDRAVEVTLVEGAVRVTEEAAAVSGPVNQTLSPGERLIVAGAAPKLDRPDIEAVTAWRRGEVVLDHTSLADAIAEMNRYSAVPLVLSTRAAAAIEVSGIFRAGDSSRFARAIADTYGIEVKEEGDRILLAGTPKMTRPQEP